MNIYVAHDSDNYQLTKFTRRTNNNNPNNVTRPADMVSINPLILAIIKNKSTHLVSGAAGSDYYIVVKNIINNKNHSVNFLFIGTKTEIIAFTLYLNQKGVYNILTELANCVSYNGLKSAKIHTSITSQEPFNTAMSAVEDPWFKNQPSDIEKLYTPKKGFKTVVFTGWKSKDFAEQYAYEIGLCEPFYREHITQSATDKYEPYVTSENAFKEGGFSWI